MPLSFREIGAMLWRLAWPIAITGQLAILAEAINIYWLDRLLGSEALAVEATLRPVLHCFDWALLSIAMGVSVLVAQSVGARDDRGLSYIASGIRLVLVVWAVIAAVVLPLAGPLSSMLASSHVRPEDVRAYGLPALLLMGPGLAMLQILLFAASGAGWTRLSLVRMFIDLCVTATLVPIFISVLDLGLAGAPLGQALSQFAMIAIVWRALYKSRQRWHLGETAAADARGRSVRPWREILGIGLPLQVARIAMFASYSYLVQRVANEGRSSVVGFGIALMLLFFALTIVSSVGRAVGIALGQAVGAKDPHRARSVLVTGLALGALAGSVAAVALYTFADRFVGLLVTEPAAVIRGVEALQILAFALVPLGCAVVLLFAFTAVKASKRAAVVGITADLVGVAFVILWPGGDELVTAAWSICLSHGLRAVSFAWLSRTVLTRGALGGSTSR